MNRSAPPEIWCTLTGQLDPAMVQRVFNFFANAMHDQVKKVHLLIQSGGGFVGDGIAIYNYLANLPIDITMYNVGGVSSIAVIVFLAGKHRVASDTATFMIHKTRASPPSGAIAAVLNEIADSLNVDNDRTETILHRYISMPSEKWDLHHHGSLTITAQEAIQFTLIHEIAPFAPLPGSTLFSIQP